VPGWVPVAVWFPASAGGKTLAPGIEPVGQQPQFPGDHRRRQAAVEPVPNGFAFEGFIEFTVDFDWVGIHGSPNPLSVNSKQPQPLISLKWTMGEIDKTRVDNGENMRTVARRFSAHAFAPQPGKRCASRRGNGLQIQISLIQLNPWPLRHPSMMYVITHGVNT
jgi:hypothetical protein